MRELFHFQTMAQEMMAADRERDAMLRAMDDMWHNRWALPPNVAGLKWIHKVVSSDPHDAIRAGARVLSSVAPRVTVRSLRGESMETERVERALAWQFANASRRRRASVLRDVALSALLYDEVVAQVVYLPYQAAAQLGMEKEQHAPRMEAMGRFGPFAIIVRNPQQVHVRYSDWMPEAVLMKKVMPLQEAVDFWGERAAGLETLSGVRARHASPLRHKRPEFRHCTVYDFMDLEQRAVWAVPQAGGDALVEPTGGGEGGAVEILCEEHGLGFLPWAAKVGGTTLADGAGQQRIPLLYSVFSSGQWETQNIVETLLTSEMIAYAAAPRLKVSGPSDSIEVDYGEPGRPAYVPPGHDLSPMAPPGLDQGLAQIAQRVSERMAKSTVPRVLQSGEMPPGTAFATLNLATQSAIKALAPYKELAEDALAEVFSLMLNWMQQSGDELQGLDTRRGRSQMLRIAPKELADLAVEVELTADVPTDRMARINAASMAVRDLGYSRERALEQIGETDAREVMLQAAREQLDAVDLEIEKRRRLAEFEQGLAAKVEAAPGDNGSDQGFNPAVGGTPPVVANPDAVALDSRQSTVDSQQ